MNLEEIALQVAGHEVEIKHHTEQIASLQQSHKALQDMAASLAVMARDQKTLTKKVDAGIAKVDVLESIPSKRWDSLITALIGAIVGIIVGMIMKGGI